MALHTCTTASRSPGRRASEVAMSRAISPAYLPRAVVLMSRSRPSMVSALAATARLDRDTLFLTSALRALRAAGERRAASSAGARAARRAARLAAAPAVSSTLAHARACARTCRSSALLRARMRSSSANISMRSRSAASSSASRLARTAGSSCTSADARAPPLAPEPTPRSGATPRREGGGRLRPRPPPPPTPSLPAGGLPPERFPLPLI